MAISPEMLKVAVDAYNRGKGNPIDDWMRSVIETVHEFELEEAFLRFKALKQRQREVVEDGPPPLGTQIDRTPKPWWNLRDKEFWEN